MRDEFILPSSSIALQVSIIIVSSIAPTVGYITFTIISIVLLQPFSLLQIFDSRISMIPVGHGALGCLRGRENAGRRRGGGEGNRFQRKGEGGCYCFDEAFNEQRSLGATRATDGSGSGGVGAEIADPASRVREGVHRVPHMAPTHTQQAVSVHSHDGGRRNGEREGRGEGGGAGEKVGKTKGEREQGKLKGRKGERKGGRKGGRGRRRKGRRV